MTNEQRIEELAQQIYLARNNDRNDVAGSELTSFLDNTIDWVNQFLPELDKEAYWSWVRENNYEMGIIGSTDEVSFALPITVRTVVKDPERPVHLVKDGRVISTFDVVSPSLIKNLKSHDNEPRAAIVGRNLVLSRELTDEELGATVYADVVHYLPKLSRDDVTVLDIVDPVQLIVLGVLKNQVLPDIVQGGLTPSYTQKYADLLEGAKAENEGSSQAEDALGDNLGFVRGVW